MLFGGTPGQFLIAVRASLHPLHAFVRGNDGLDGAVVVELHLVDAHFAVHARLVLDVVLIDAVVDDVPLVFSRNLEHGVVCRAIDFLVGALDEDDRVLRLRYMHCDEPEEGSDIDLILKGYITVARIRNAVIRETFSKS